MRRGVEFCRAGGGGDSGLLLCGEIWRGGEEILWGKLGRGGMRVL